MFYDANLTVITGRNDQDTPRGRTTVKVNRTIEAEHLSDAHAAILDYARGTLGLGVLLDDPDCRTTYDVTLIGSELKWWPRTGTVTERYETGAF